MPLIIRKQPSGAAAATIGSPSSGRGEYELVGESGTVTASSLRGSSFIWRTRFGLKETRVALGNQGGKWRLRLVGEGPHIHRQAAVLAMLPRPTRDERRVSYGLPTVLENRYLLDIETSLMGRNDEVATIRPDVFVGRSGPAADLAHRVELPADDRFQRIQTLWTRIDGLPAELADAVGRHRDRILDTDRIDFEAERAVKRILSALNNVDVAEFVPGADPLEILEALAGLSAQVELPLPIEAPTDSPEIRLRLESAWRLRRDRGTSHRQFKRALQKAYNYTCAFCGAAALRVGSLAPHGLDAAHILPWSEYDLDHVTNGVLLCKTDHWMFDQHILILHHDSGDYFVKLNPEFDGVPLSSGSAVAIQKAVGKIPTARLPKIALRPNPEFISALYEGLEV